MINPKIVKLFEKDSPLFNSPFHGIYHWKTVERNGLYLAKFTGADLKVVSYFGYFHDCMRNNEDHDPKHGSRGAEYAKVHKDLLDLTEEQLNKLCLACSGHTDGRWSSCVTITTCWDADRLDIGRVGIKPDSKYLFSEEAKRIADEQDYEIIYVASTKDG